MTDTTRIIEEIRAALEADPYEGPWAVEEFQHDERPCALIVSAGGTIIAEIRGYIDSCGNGENARFIVACSPDRIRALLDHITELRKGTAEAIREGLSAVAEQRSRAEAAEARVRELEVALNEAASLFETLSEDLPEDDVSGVMMRVMADRNRAILTKGEKQ